MRRLLVFALVFGALMAPGSAGAHGGYPVVDGTDGPYSVLVQVSRLETDGKPALDLTTYLTRQDLGEPDLTPRVTLRIDDGERVRTIRPRVSGDGYETIVPGEPGAWRRWAITVTVDGAAGRSVVRAAPRERYSGVPGWTWPVIAVIVVVLGGASLWAVRRRLRHASSSVAT